MWTLCTQCRTVPNVARYREIAEDLRRRLSEGEWEPGQRIASITQLQGEYGGPGLNVIRDAESVLIGDGILRADHGVGVFVVALPAADAGATVEGLGEELERISRAATRAVTLWRQQQEPDGDDAVGVAPSSVRRWAWMTSVQCPTCDLHTVSSRGWIDPDETDAAELDEDRCREQGHPVTHYYGPDPDADQQAAAAVEQWWERHAHAMEAARLLAPAGPGSARDAHWHAHQVRELTTQMPDELSYRVHVTAG